MLWDSCGFPIVTRILCIVIIIIPIITTIMNTSSTVIILITIIIITGAIVNLNVNIDVMTIALILFCRVFIDIIRIITTVTITEKLSLLRICCSYVCSHYCDSSMEKPEPHGSQEETARRRIILGISSGYSQTC